MLTSPATRPVNGVRIASADTGSTAAAKAPPSDVRTKWRRLQRRSRARLANSAVSSDISAHKGSGC